MTTDFFSQQLARGQPGPQADALHAMLEARSVALVGASRRPGSFGARMLAEVAKSAAGPAVYPVNPRYPEIEGRSCYPSLADLPTPADLVLLGVPDTALEEQLALAAARGCRSAVIFGNAHEDSPPSVPGPAPGQEPGADSPRTLRQRLASIALSAGMELCGAGCMGFANVGRGLRAMGYVEPDPLPAGPVALVSCARTAGSASRSRSPPARNSSPRRLLTCPTRSTSRRRRFSRWCSRRCASRTGSGRYSPARPNTTCPSCC